MGENGYDVGSETMSRLEALEGLRALTASRKIAVDLRGGGINTHIHTSKSFSFFCSPSEAVWMAHVAGITVLGINDHYTVSGHEEFREACRILRILPTFSMEAVARWEDAERTGKTVNDPSNPGRTYLTAKGVTRDFALLSQGARDLAQMNKALIARNREITERIAALIEARLGVQGGVGFAVVLRLTPHDQPTERHVAKAAALFVETRYKSGDERKAALEKLCGEGVTDEVMGDPARLQNFLRARLIKAGCPAFVEESSDAFISVERMVSLCLDLGAIPTYPVLGNPVTPWEEDLDRLFDRLEALRIFAIEVIPDRNTRERLGDIVEKATERNFPVFNGTEHNTPSPAPMVDRFFFDEAFRPHFERGARMLLGHQALRADGRDGYVRDDGSVAGADREARVAALEAVGAKLRNSGPGV